jgi:hypothetical protein
MRNLGQYLRFEAMDKKGNYNADYPETIAVPVRMTNITYTYAHSQ